MGVVISNPRIKDDKREEEWKEGEGGRFSRVDDVRTRGSVLMSVLIKNAGSL